MRIDAPPVGSSIRAGNRRARFDQTARNNNLLAIEGSLGQGLDLHALLHVLRRRKLIIIALLLLGVTLAWLIRAQITPRYAAEAVVVLDVRSTHILKFDSVLSNLPPEPDVVRTELDMIGSRTMAERVVDRLTPDDTRRLAAAARARPPLARWLHRAWTRLVRFASRMTHDELRLAPAAETVGDAEPPTRDDLVDMLLSGLKVSNDSRSYTLHIGFAWADRQLVATIANLYAEEYLANQVALKSKATKRASAWLSERLVELRRRLEASEQAIEDYRHQAGIQEHNGVTVTAQQLAEINSQLVLAHSARAEAESRLHTAQSLAQNGSDDIEAYADVLSSTVVQALREKLTEVRRKQADLDSRVTAIYPTRKGLQVDLAELQAQVHAEAGRVVKKLGGEAETARARERSLAKDLASLQAKFSEAGQAGVHLRQLEREADANRVVYEAYLGRFKETSEQQELQEPDAYLISRAQAPETPTYPRTLPILALGFILGGVAGGTWAFAVERLDRRLRSVGQVEQVTGLPVLGLLPRVPPLHLSNPEKYVLSRPTAMFSEALRTTRTAIELSRPDQSSQVVLVTSAVPREGKTTFCLSLARSFAMDGGRVLLIDADLRRPGVGEALEGGRGSGLTELLLGRIDRRAAIQHDPKSGAHYIAARHGGLDPQRLLGSERMAFLIQDVREAYDLILIDTAPILGANDAAILARLADSCLLFVRWGCTPRNVVIAALKRLALYRVKVSGIVLSQVNMRKHARYADGEDYHRAYG